MFRRLFRVLFALLGLVIFGVLVKRSGVTLPMIERLGWSTPLVLIVIAGLVAVLDALAWLFIARTFGPVRYRGLLALRIAGDAFTNSLPGGVLLGEPYKAYLLRHLYRVALPEGFTTLLLMKIAVGVSQVFFILSGLVFIYPLLRRHSVELVGFHGAHHLALFITLGMFILLLIPVGMMLHGSSFTKISTHLHALPLPPLQRMIESKHNAILALDASAHDLLTVHRGRYLLCFLSFLAGWFLTTIESKILLSAMGYAPSWSDALVIESLGSLFRLVFFMVPSGIGGQDASFLALFRLYKFSPTAGGIFILIKRLKELVWIALGFLLIPLLPKPTTEK